MLRDGNWIDEKLCRRKTTGRKCRPSNKGRPDQPAGDDAEKEHRQHRILPQRMLLGEIVKPQEDRRKNTKSNPRHLYKVKTSYPGRKWICPFWAPSDCTRCGSPAGTRERLESKMQTEFWSGKLQLPKHWNRRASPLQKPTDLCNRPDALARHPKP